MKKANTKAVAAKKEMIELPNHTALWPEIKSVLSSPVAVPQEDYLERLQKIVAEKDQAEEEKWKKRHEEALATARAEAEKRKKELEADDSKKAAEAAEVAAAEVAAIEEQKPPTIEHVMPGRSFPLVYAIVAIGDLIKSKQGSKKKEGAASAMVAMAAAAAEKEQEQEHVVNVVDRCRGLVHFVDNVLNDEEATLLVGGMFQLALSIEQLFPEGTAPNLPSQRVCSATLTRMQVACLLAHALFGTYSVSADTFEFTFRSLLEMRRGCGICHGVLRYFIHVLQAEKAGTPLCGSVSVYRSVLNVETRPLIGARNSWANEIGRRDVPLCEVVLDDEQKIEEQPTMLQADFANRHLGGGVLGGGCVQEEIRFGISSPELLVGMLLAHESMRDNESIVLTGTEIVSRYEGYGGGVTCAGPYNDPTARGPDGTIASTVVAIDALMLPTAQFERSCVERDLCKACVGFSCPYPADHPLAALAQTDVATGKWGCGVFGGDPEMKFLQQWLAVSASGKSRKMLFCTFHDKGGVPDKLRAIVDACRGDEAAGRAPIRTVRQLYDKMLAYAKARQRCHALYESKVRKWDLDNISAMERWRAEAERAKKAGKEPPAKPKTPPKPEEVSFTFAQFVRDGGSSDSACTIC